jgi:hypothetical protein
MRAISVHVEDEDYQRLKSLAAREGRPVAVLIRQAMADYLDREGRSGRSILDIRPHKSGKLLRSWTRAEIYDEILDERR